MTLLHNSHLLGISSCRIQIINSSIGPDLSERDLKYGPVFRMDSCVGDGLERCDNGLVKIHGEGPLLEVAADDGKLRRVPKH